MIDRGPASWTAEEWQSVIRTIGTVITSILSAIGLLYARRANINAKATNDQTSTKQWVDGEQRSVSVMDMTQHAAHESRSSNVASQATRQEVSDLAIWVKGTGRRRLPTTEITPVQKPKGTHYE